MSRRERKPPWTKPGVHTPALQIAALLHGVGLGLRRIAYRLGLKRRHRVGLPVICIGNITVGGTGKTPAVIAVCERLRSIGQRPAVVSRGYGADKSRHEILRVDPMTSDWRRVGDEPLLIARVLGDVPVYVGADRVAVAKRVCEDTDATVIVLDDGFQHWRLARDLDIVLLDGTDPLGNQRLLPAGPLRETTAALHRAGVVILTKVNLIQGAPGHFVQIESQLHAPVLQAIHRPARIWDLISETGESVETMRGKRVVLISGLARNEAFQQLVESLGAEVTVALGLGDHQGVGPDEWRSVRVALEDSGADFVLTTAKDAVKWQRSEIEGLPIKVLEITFEIPNGAERLWSILRATVGK